MGGHLLVDLIPAMRTAVLHWDWADLGLRLRYHVVAGEVAAPIACVLVAESCRRWRFSAVTPDQLPRRADCGVRRAPCIA